MPTARAAPAGELAGASPGIPPRRPTRAPGVVVVVLAVLASSCVASHPPAPRECPEGLPYLFRRDVPPEGRMHACEACARTEEICGRRLPCTLTGACDYAALVERWDRMDCDLEDPCVRPDPELYWRPEGD